MAYRISDLLREVDEAYRLDTDSLQRYASANIPDFPSSPSPLVVKQFGHGQSNPTYMLETVDGRDGSVKRYVLRKKPHGKLLQSAHAIEREFQVLRALGEHTKVPVPKVFCLCEDPNVIGTAFYVMEYLEGRIFVNPKLPGLSPSTRRAVYMETAKALAFIHSVNVDAIGIGNYGRRKDYCKRQVERWARQYMESTGEGKSPRYSRMLELVNWLRQNVPHEDSLNLSSGIVHGDFRIDNVVFHETEDRVIGILDWELSTLGNQMCDVAYSCLAYLVDINVDNQQLGNGLEASGTPPGIPLMTEYLAEYCLKSGKPWPASHWKFYVAFSLFRVASIYAGVHSRWIMGNASGGTRAKFAGPLANALIDFACTYVERESVLATQSVNSLEKTDRLGTQNLLQLRGNYFPGARVLELSAKLVKFMEDNIYPMEKEFYELANSSSRWTVHPAEEKLQDLAKREGLWNLWIPFDSAQRARSLIFDGADDTFRDEDSQLFGAGLSNLEYGFLCEIMGRSVWAPQIFNCNAPDTGNMEVLLRYGNKEQLITWLIPLLKGEIRSGFAMTEPQVASSDATNIECSIKRHGDSYIINGRKWWTSGAMDPRCRLLIVMGKTDFNASKHQQQSMILVDMKTPGVNIKRPLMVFGFDDAPHGHAEILFDNVTVPAKNIILGEGRGFEIAQGRLGPGRLHHCMRLVGAAERGMQLMVQRALSRTTFGRAIAQHGSFRSDVAKCRIELEKTRLLVLEAAQRLDKFGNKESRGIIAMAKVAAPSMALMVLDMAMQVHGAAGVSSDTVLPHLWAIARTLRIADGPDEVHLSTIFKLELQRAKL